MATRINPGAMRERITFERPFETLAPSGAASIQWIYEATLRAELVQEDTEAFLASVDRTEDRKVFRCWATPFVTTDLRLTHDDRTYRIAKIVPVFPNGLELHCVDGDGQ